ncbi:MAG: hypothetical protein ACI4KR_09240 [Ruminiclostridium sp.]
MVEKEYIEREAAYDIATLEDWYINSVSDNDTPVWTEEHLEELLNDFYVIPKDTPAADVVKVVRCKDCKWYKESHLLAPNKFCFRLKHKGEYIGYNFSPDDFCSYGERNDNNGKL